MPELSDKPRAIREFFSLALGKTESAFMYLGYSGVILRVEGRVVAIDIANLLGNREIGELSRLDLLVFTHTHGDHYNRARAREAVEKTNAHVVAQQQVAEDLKPRIPPSKLTAAKSGAPVSVGDFEIVAVDGVHPRPISTFRIRNGRFSMFHGGDSGYIPVTDYPAKVAFLPTGSPSPSCSPESALKFALDLRPSVAVAMHGSQAQMEEFKGLVERDLPDTTVIIPRLFEANTIVL